MTPETFLGQFLFGLFFGLGFAVANAVIALIRWVAANASTGKPSAS